ncbi:MAG: ABC transporter ATP-binding protein [Magnetococcales bacterium]|nr:ABC transporter ATP-binding protein [Magnetococcales bacterium]MBF0322147.1 ABC transporter ATP-binding protein [Magnetococcales bacterium]
MSENMIEVSELTRYYGLNRVLDRISLNVRRGEVMGFLGPNGAGKTTTMRILAGLLAPTEGSIRVAGMDILEKPEAARAKIGFLPESPPIYDDMTVREYLAYLASLRGVPTSRLKDALDRAMTHCGLSDQADRLLGHLSKGYRQRAGIAQAIVHSPEVVILDEPTAGLDPLQIREIRSLIRTLGGEHSVLLSTHILPEVQMTCDRVALIHQGRIVVEDTLAGLEQRSQQRARITVRWGLPPDKKAIMDIPGVAAVSMEEELWHITPQEQADPVPELVRRSVSGNWDLRELTPNAHSLEDIFVQLTKAESDSVTPAEVNS